MATLVIVLSIILVLALLGAALLPATIVNLIVLTKALKEIKANK